MKRKIIVIIAFLGILLASLGLMYILFGMKKTPEIQKPEEVVRHVKTTEVVYNSIKSGITASGRLGSNHYVNLSSEVQGKILKGNIPLKKGQTFRQGSLLFKIYDKEAVLNLKSKKSRFLTTVANILPDIKIDFSSSYDKWNSFFLSLDIEKPLPDIPKEASGKEKIFLASRNILSDYYSIKSDEIRLGKYFTRAPFSGTFTEVFMETGSIANPGSKVAQIARTDQMELEVPVEANSAFGINIGDIVKVATADNRQWNGKVVRKSNFIDPKTQSMLIFVSLQSSKKNPLYKGQYMEATFPGLELQNVMEIPRNAVFNHNEVFIVVNKHLLKKEIRILKINENTLVFTGLDKGSELVIEPLINVTDNMKVETIKE